MAVGGKMEIKAEAAARTKSGMRRQLPKRRAVAIVGSTTPAAHLPYLWKRQATIDRFIQPQSPRLKVIFLVRHDLRKGWRGCLLARFDGRARSLASIIVGVRDRPLAIRGAHDSAKLAGAWENITNNDRT